MSKFKQFCYKYEKQLQFFETLAIIFVFICLAFLTTEKYFLSYKVVLVEQDVQGKYNVVKELLVNGRITEPIFLINTSQKEHTFSKLIIDTYCQTDEQCIDNQILYNIST